MTVKGRMPLDSCHANPAHGGIASSTLKAPACFFAFSACGRKFKPPASQVVVDFYQAAKW